MAPGSGAGGGMIAPGGNADGGPTEMFGATGTIGPCGIPTPPYGVTRFLPALPGLKKSQTSVAGCVLHPVIKNNITIQSRRFMEVDP